METEPLICYVYSVTKMKIMLESWKPIKGYEGLYEVSSLGNVKSLRRGIILKPVKTKYGYLHVGLHKNKSNKKFLIHRLVAAAFIPNPDNLPIINHKDEIKIHNFVENLEWCDQKFNVNYGTSIERRINTNVNNGLWDPEMVGLDEKTYKKIYNEKYYQNHKEDRRLYADNHKEERKEYMKKYRENNKEEIKESRRLYYQNHKS